VQKPIHGTLNNPCSAEFSKPKPLYKIAMPPFHAAWATPVLHNTRAPAHQRELPGDGPKRRGHRRPGGASAGGLLAASRKFFKEIGKFSERPQTS